MNIYTIVSIGLIFLVLYLIYSRKNIWENFAVDVVTPGYYKLKSMQNLELWLDSAGTDDVSTKDGVFKWFDRAKGRVAQVFKPDQPLPIRENKPGLYPGVKLTYSSTVNNGLYVPIPAGTFSTGVTVFIVAKKEGEQYTYESLFNRTNSNFPRPFAMHNTSRYLGNLLHYKEAKNASGFNVGSVGSSQIYVSSHVITPTTWKEYLNDNQVMDFSFSTNEVTNANPQYGLTTATSMPYEDGVDKFYIGTREDSFVGFNGRIYDVLVFSGPLNDEDYKYVMNYLMIKWNINSNYSDLYSSQYELQNMLTDLSNNSSNCNFITICKMKYKSNFNYEQVGCTNMNPLTQLVRIVKNLDEATDLARTYGATVFALTAKNELYIGFSYDTKTITPINQCGSQQTIKVYCAIPTVQTNPTFYGYPYYCSYKSNSSSADFKNIINMTFNNMDSKYNMGKVSNLTEARAKANSYGATAFFIDVNSNLWITYNFNRALIDPTVKSKSKSSSINETIYFAVIRTSKIQLSHKNCI